jgi:hypothetical protein
MLYLFLILAIVFVLVPLSLEWSTKGWQGTIVAQALADISSPFGTMRNPVGNLAREGSDGIESVREAWARFLSELKEATAGIRKVAQAVTKLIQAVAHMVKGSPEH